MTGYARELLDRFSADTKLDLHYQLMPVKRLYGKFFGQDGIQLKYPDSPDWQSHLRVNADVHYSKPLVTAVDGVFTVRGGALGVTDLKRLGTIRGFTPEAYLDAIHDGRVALVEYNKTSDMLMALLAGRVDGVYLNVDVARYQLKVMGANPAHVDFNLSLPHKQVDYRLSSISRPDIIKQFDDWFFEHRDFVCELKLTYGFVRDECIR